MNKGTKSAIIICMLVITSVFSIVTTSIAYDERTIPAEKYVTESGPAFEVGLYTCIGNGLSGYGLEIAVKNIGDATAHNVTLTDLTIEGMVLYNNRDPEWYRDIEPGVTLLGYPESLFLGFGTFTATMTVTCDEGVNGTGTGNGLMFGPLIFVP